MTMSEADMMITNFIIFLHNLSSRIRMHDHLGSYDTAAKNALLSALRKCYQRFSGLRQRLATLEYGHVDHNSQLSENVLLPSSQVRAHESELPIRNFIHFIENLRSQIQLSIFMNRFAPSDLHTLRQNLFYCYVEFYEVQGRLNEYEREHLDMHQLEDAVDSFENDVDDDTISSYSASSSESASEAHSTEAAIAYETAARFRVARV